MLEVSGTSGWNPEPLEASLEVEVWEAKEEYMSRNFTDEVSLGLTDNPWL